MIESPVIVEIESGGPSDGALPVHAGSRASLIPVNCQRVSGERNFDRCGECDSERGAGTTAQDVLVAHEFAVVLAECAGSSA